MASSDTAARRATDTDLIGNRKLIRPSLSDLREQIAKSVPQPGPTPHRPAKKPVPPDQTNAENFYYVKQMQSKTTMVFVLQDGERIRGIIEWYDRHCLKIHRSHEPNLLVYKSNIKYLYKAEDEHARAVGRD
jgi:sRNA-binding regulator protein Hfq